MFSSALLEEIASIDTGLENPLTISTMAFSSVSGIIFGMDLLWRKKQVCAIIKLFLRRKGEFVPF